MAVTKLPDGRWICYYRIGKKLKKEYFGRGPEAEISAKTRDLKASIERMQHKIDLKEAELRSLKAKFGYQIYPKKKG